jgi:hypothetical protein
MPPGADFYPSMTALYSDPQNLEGTTYGKRWLWHQWQQLIEEQSTDNTETQKIVMAIHGGGIEAGTSEIALAAAGFHPATLMPSDDGQGSHDLWLFEGLLARGNGRLHVTASNYDDPIATELVLNARRCISLHGCSDRQAKGKAQLSRSGCRSRLLRASESAEVAVPRCRDVTDDRVPPSALGVFVSLHHNDDDPPNISSVTRDHDDACELPPPEGGG